jgi:diaminohydroxyphosphoribosylaminopyrimidine deaminase / 5-amino-6-(5-phosphoribosylamino)uracil reductase
MRRCFDLARMAGKHVQSNPQVGAVIVHNGRIIGEGYHEHFGSAHAEVNAIHSVSAEDRRLLTEATIFVSLEPCNHVGKTGPCTNAILDAGIRKVVVSCLDPSPIMAGKSILFLQSKGIDVAVGLSNDDGTTLIKPFIANLQLRPYVVLKWAQSSDGFIGRQGERIQLSGESSSIMTHKWRSKVDGILVGKKTVVTDNPSLTTRQWIGENPLRVVLDTNLHLTQDSMVFSDGFPTLVINEIETSSKGSVRFLKVDNIIDIKAWLQILYHQGIYRLLVEGGAEVLQSFIDAKMWDEARIFTCPSPLMDGIKAPSIVLQSVEHIAIDRDILNIGYRND